MSLDTKKDPKDLTTKDAGYKNLTGKAEYRWESERQRDKRLVKGVFQCHQPQGGSVKFSFKAYKGNPVETYEFHHGKTYEIPLAVAKHLNENCNYPVYSEVLGPDGLRSTDVSKRVQRFNFVRLFDDGV